MRTNPMPLLMIGGSDAGISAGLRARQVNPAAEVRLLVADAYPNVSICGIPYYVSGDVPDRRRLAHRSPEDLHRAGLRLKLHHRGHRAGRHHGLAGHRTHPAVVPNA